MTFDLPNVGTFELHVVSCDPWFSSPPTCVADVSTIDFADVYEHFGWPGCWETHEVQISLHQKDRFVFFFNILEFVTGPKIFRKKLVNWVQFVEMSGGFLFKGSYAPSRKTGEFPR